MEEDTPGGGRWSLDDLALETVVAHHGEGTIGFARLVDRTRQDGALHFVDLAVLPPGSSIGTHTHHADEEEFYVVLEGEGEMCRDGETFTVKAGEVIRNRPGGTHGLRNTGSHPLRLFVFELHAGTSR